MHAFQSQAHRLPAIQPAVAVSADPPLPWSAAPMDRAAAQWIWHSRFGTIVIEVRGDDVFVNGDRVTPHAP